MRSLFLLATAASAVSAVSPVQKVVQLLGELKGKVEKDLAAEGKAMDEYVQFCDDEITEKKFNIKTASSDIERFQAVVEDSAGQIQAHDATISSSGATIASKNQELAGATDVRGKEHKDFIAAEKELVDTVDMLARAATVLKRELSFAQVNGKSTSSIVKKMGNMIEALGAITSAAWVDPKQAKAVKSFLESEDELSLKQPQAASYNYESKSGGIVDTLHDMQDKAEDQLASLRKDETRARHAFELLQQGLNDAVANLEKVVAETNAAKSAAEETKAKAEEDLAKTQDAKAADEKYLAKMEQNCASKANEWAARQKTANGEIAALAKASEVLSSGVKVFAQVSASTKVVKAESDSQRNQLIKHLRKMSRTYNSFALMQIANRAGSDPFGKVRGLIENMIASLEKQAQEEATHEAFCQEETAKSAKKREEKEGQVEKYQTRLDKAKAGVAQLEIEISDLTQQVGAIDKSNAEATALRQKENAQYKQASQDQKESIEAVAKAIEVLNNFYGNAALLQQAPTFQGAQSDSGNNIISFLEVAQSDFSTMLAETEADEAEAQTAYDTLTQENAVAKATKNASIKGKTSEVKSLKVAIQDNTADLATENKELDAVLDYIEKLKPQCDNKAMSYEERKSRREAELQGLNTALDILSGEEVAVSLLQKKAFLAKHA